MASGPPRWPLLLTATLVVVAGCTSIDRPRVQPDEVPLPTPMRSYDASVSATISELKSAAGSVGRRLDVPSVAYRPSEPKSLLQVPRVVLRADLADPDDGFVVIYEAAGDGAARELAQELAEYLASGFGQTNFTPDTQFSVAVLGDTVIFSTWSRGRSADPAAAEALFDALATVGEAVPVQK